MRDNRKAGFLFLLASLAFLIAGLLADPQRAFNYTPAVLFLVLGVARLARSRQGP